MTSKELIDELLDCFYVDGDGQVHWGRREGFRISHLITRDFEVGQAVEAELKRRLEKQKGY